MWTVATYVLKQKLMGGKRYPFVLMLSRCSAAIWLARAAANQYPAHILKTDLSRKSVSRPLTNVARRWFPSGRRASDAPQINEIVEGLVARKKYIYLCTNALLLKEKLHLFKPSKYLTFSVHVDGQKEHHDFFRLPRGWLRFGHRRHPGSCETGLPRNNEHNFV